MSSLFITPASQRKRKRTENGTASAAKRRNTTAKTGERKGRDERAKARRDESISGSELGTDEERPARTPEEEEDVESDENETAADRRRRLAEQYLENTRKETVDAIGFDAADLDRDLIAERLKEDVAEEKGKLYRHIAATLDFEAAVHTNFRADTLATTAIAACPPYVYTASKDCTLIKWQLPESASSREANGDETPSFASKPNAPPRRPKQVLFTKGDKQFTPRTSDYSHHTQSILAIAASPSGTVLATGGSDRKIIIWSTADLTVLRQFTQHRDAVTALSFRGTSNQLFSGSKDRTVKVWNIDELGGSYIETLHGHEDQVVDVAAIPGKEERCISVGARDRTARLWKVVEEQQLVFRGGGSGRRGHVDRNLQPLNPSAPNHAPHISYAEGSIERVCIIDSTLFITGSDNGTLSLWSLHKKKPIHTYDLAHGADPPPPADAVSAEQDPRSDPSTRHRAPQPRWITALKSVPFSDVFVSGSWDGWVRAWRVGEDKRSIEALGRVGRVSERVVNGATSDAKVDADGVVEAVRTNGTQSPEGPQEPVLVRGVVNDLDIFERGERGRDGVCIVAAVGNEHRLGRWLKVKGKNRAVLIEVPRKNVGMDGRGLHGGESGAG